jgi:Cys-tRNA(Pro)/Cys-tRNA(Cys) deacylase
MAATEFKNNVTRFLDAQKVKYQVFVYDYDAGVHSAVEVAAAIGLPPGQVFKTLVALVDEPGRKPLLVIIPGPDTLDLKALAKAVNAKKVKMSTP